MGSSRVGSGGQTLDGQGRRRWRSDHQSRHEQAVAGPSESESDTHTQQNLQLKEWGDWREKVDFGRMGKLRGGMGGIICTPTSMQSVNLKPPRIIIWVLNFAKKVQI